MNAREQILKFVNECDHSPTIREIGAAVGLSSPATVFKHLDRLERQGKIRRIGGRVYPAART